MATHVIKYEYNDGKKLIQPVTWCGRKVWRSHGFLFQDAQHVALASGGSVQPCKSCIKAIIKELKKELENK